jgi:hypothetical protein
MTLEKIVNQFSAFVSSCISSCTSILKIILLSKFKVSLPKATSPSCIILGNGPSLNKSLQKYPAAFKKHDLICVNRFALADEYTELRPAYYVMLDPSFWGDAEDIAHTTNELIRKTTWELHLLVPQGARKSKLVQAIQKQNTLIHIHYFNYTVFRGFSSLAHFFYNLKLASPQSQNVLVISIFLSISIGFKNIHIVGADHTWHENLYVNESNQLCVKDVHFYDNAEQVNYRLFYKDAKQVETFTMAEILMTFGKVFLGYDNLKKYADSLQAKVYNCSEISFIDVFPRKKIENLL